MGSSGSSIGEHRCGEWINCRCFCPNGEKEIYYNSNGLKIYLESTYIVYNGIRIFTDIARNIIEAVTAEKSEEEVFKRQDFCHGYVRIYMRCSECKCNKNVTFEYGGFGRRWRVGRFNKYFKQYSSCTPTNMTMRYVLDKFKKIEGFEEKDYHFTQHNCQHFAKKFYEDLVNIGTNESEISRELHFM